MISLLLLILSFSVLIGKNHCYTNTSQSEFYSIFSTSFVLALGFQGAISMILIWNNISNFPLAFLSLIFLISCFLINNQSAIFLKSSLHLINDDFKVFLLGDDKKINLINISIVFLIFWLYLISFGPINHPDASNIYVGYPYTMWLKNAHFVDGGLKQGFLGLGDFANLAFFQESSIWLIRTVQAIPIFTSVLFLLRNKTNKLYIFIFLTSPVFLQWLTVGKAPFYGDLCLAICYLSWRKTFSSLSFKLLLITILMNISFKITGLVIVVPILLDILLNKEKIRIIDLLDKKLSHYFLFFIALFCSFTMLLYRFNLTGNFIYPLFSSIFNSGNEFLIQKEQDWKSFRREGFYFLYLIVPRNIGFLSGALGLSSAIIYAKELVNNALNIKKDSLLLVPFLQTFLLVFFGQGRANYYALPFVLLIYAKSKVQIYDFKIFNKNILKVLKYSFLITMVFQFVIYITITSISLFQTVYSFYSYEDAMNKYGLNYQLSKTINKNAKKPNLILEGKQSRLFNNNSKYVVKEKFNDCLNKNSDKNDILNEDNFLNCINKFGVQSIVIKRKDKYNLNNFECSNYNILYGARNYFWRKNKETYICNKVN